MSPEIAIALLGVCIPVFGNIIIELIRNNSSQQKTAIPKIELPPSVSLSRSSPRDKTKNWLITGMVALIFGAIGYFIGTVLFGQNTATSVPPSQEKRVLETIQFDYTDSPLNHGWTLVEGDHEKVFFEGINDDTVGKAIKITTSDDNIYAIDYNLTFQTSEFGNFLEVVARYLDDKSSFYAYVRMINNNGDTLSGWLKLKVGKERILPSQKTTGEQEWLVYIYPQSFLDQNWVKMGVDLRKIVQETFGKDGWSFQKIIKFRIRGNLWMDSIEISEITSN
ncbi:MAG: hypothetical protein HY869_02170 [Chloroflexi bacterium]|nr:hypothetical protein [Chloroflexota bacterium]